MSNIQSIKNKIQVHIIEYLFQNGASPFRAMRPARTDSNLLSYHVTKLLNEGYVRKTDNLYELADKGWRYVDRVLTHSPMRTQPSVETVYVIQNDDGDVLLVQSGEAWGLPKSRVDIDDVSLMNSARSYAKTMLTLPSVALRHVGDCYVRVRRSEVLLSSTLFHIMRTELSESPSVKDGKWVGLHSLHKYVLTPGTDAIISRSFFGDGFFFEEFDESPLY